MLEQHFLRIGFDVRNTSNHRPIVTLKPRDGTTLQVSVQCDEEGTAGKDKPCCGP
jgi:hypothetical protein